MEKLLNSAQLAEYLNVKTVTVQRKAARGEIPSVRIGKRFRFDKQRIDRWLQQNANGEQANILVIDKEPIIGQLIDSILKGKYYQVTTTVSSLEALKLVANGHFDLIFLDLAMKELNGVEVFRRIREMGKLVPIAIITGHPDSDLYRRVMELAPLTVIKKPFQADEILSTVRSAVQGRVS